MLDQQCRTLSRPALDGVGRWLFRRGVKAAWVTANGWLLGIGACVAVGFRLWPVALVAWLMNRLMDGVDGAVARQEGATDRGGFLDLMADFSIYSGFVVALALAIPADRMASLVLLFTYYLSGAALLAATGLLDRAGYARSDERSIHFQGGLAEGVETTVAYVLIVVMPARATLIEWIFATMVFITALQRVVWACRALGVTRRVAVVDSPSSNVA